MLKGCRASAGAPFVPRTRPVYRMCRNVMNSQANKPLIIAAQRTIDGRNGPAMAPGLEDALCRFAEETVRLEIDPLEKGWKSPLEENHFRSGCAPLEALSRAVDLIVQHPGLAVVIEGTDRLISDFSNRTADRRSLMNIYGENCPLPEAYTLLAHAFIEQAGIRPELFKQAAGMLYGNYARTALENGSYEAPSDKWFAYITDLFRGVDCANPVIDFSGALIVASVALADRLDIAAHDRVAVLGVATAELYGDGPAHVAEIATYDHLRQAYDYACDRAGVPFADLFLQGQALLEVYSCFPVVPMAFLLASGIAPSFEDIAPVLDEHAVTITGGMNVARAPWNNPALNGLICMYEKIRSGKTSLGAVHGNGGLGYKQGVALLGAA